MRAQARIPAVADATRSVLRVVAITAAVALGLIAARYAGVNGPGGLDTAVEAKLDVGLGSIRGGLRRFVFAAGPVAVVWASLVLALGCVALGRLRLAVVAVVGPLLTGVATTALQPLIGRRLNGGFALPSGHTGGITAVAIVAALIALSFASRRLRSVAALHSAIVIATGTTMAAALVVNDLHVVTDTVAGFCTAVSVVLAVALALDRIADRPDRPAAAHR